MIVAEDFYLLRAPLLPLKILQQFNKLPHGQLSERLKVVFSNARLQEAIYIASPELYEQFSKWQQGYLHEKEIDKLVLSLFKYLLRMCVRCTPYGLFAGCSMGAVDEVSQIKIASEAMHKKHTRLDMNYVAELAAMITKLPTVQQQLLYYPNNSLYKIANNYRYAEYIIENKLRSYYLTEVTGSAYLEKIIQASVNGVTFSVLTESIIDNNVSQEDANEYINELIQSQILVSELEPAVTGEEFFNTLVKKISLLKNTENIAAILNRIHCIFQEQPAGINQYLHVHALVKELLPDTNIKDLVQADLFLHTSHNTISSTVIKDIQQQIESLWSLGITDNNSNLKNFIHAFRERYEEQEIPFVLALDAEAGIGYAGYKSGNTDYSGLIKDIVIDDNNDTRATYWGKMEKLQMQKLCSCLSDNKLEIELTDKDISELKNVHTDAFPDSFYIMGSILGNNAAAIDAGNFQFELKACAGPSGASLLGRFCHGDATLSSKIKKHLEEEAQCNPDAIYAEIIHLPEARTGNVLLRPTLRNYELLYLGNGSTSKDHQIEITDLMLSLDSNNNIILRSKKLNKQIVPRLSTAHNFSFGCLPVYKFLCDLQLQRAVTWQWNLPGYEKFFPRVRYKKIILSKCTWVLYKKDYPALEQKNSNGLIIFYKQLFSRIKEQLHLPDLVVLSEGDNELPINLNNESCIYILANTLIKKERIVLQEFLFTDNCFVEGEHGKHTNEIIIPFKKTPVIKSLNSNYEMSANGEKQTTGKKRELLKFNHIVPARTFITGSEWLYVKIYCGTNSAEKILKEVINSLVKELIAENKITQWFFIRYADPENHIRIRFHHPEDTGFWKVVLERLYASTKNYLDNSLVYTIQTDTYNREIERYGINTIELSEHIFYLDSEAVINCIDLLGDEEAEKYRWLLSARGVDMLLDDFNYSLESKGALLKKLQQGYSAEFGNNKSLSGLLNDKYRVNTQLLRSFLNTENDEENEIKEATKIFMLRSIQIRQAAKKIKNLQLTDSTTFSFDDLLPGYIHMFLNRMFLSEQRKYELVIYHFLSKYYDSQIAIKKKNITVQKACTAQRKVVLQ